MLHLRVLSALIGIPIIMLAAWYGSWALWLLTLSVFVVAALEITEILKGLGLKPSAGIICVGGLITFTSAYLYKDEYLALAILILVIINLLMMTFLYPRVTPVDIFGNLFAILYLNNLLFIFLSRELGNGFVWIVLLFTATWASDTFAYFVGRSLGRHKLAPILSPKKTIEGALGGIVGSGLTAFVMVLLVPELPMLPVILLGITIGVVSLLGDLVESALKRQAKIKDSGHIIPGHGGVLDRFDSLLFSAPLVYYGVKLFII